MVQCLNCLEYVEKLKSNSHVIPRWALAQTKENGKNLSIAYGKASRNQKDLTTDSWCEKCEKGFANLDSVGASYFRHLSTSKGSREVNFQHFKYAFQSAAVHFHTSMFIYSLAVRFYLHHVTKGLLLREERVFKDLFEKYHNQEKMLIDINDVSKFFLTTVKLPAVVKGNIQLMINGYLVVIRPHISEDPTRWVEGPKDMQILKVTDPRVPYVKSFFQAMGPIRQELSCSQNKRNIGRSSDLPQPLYPFLLS